MYSYFKRLSKKTQSAIISCICLLAAILFTSSASIFSPTNGSLGILFGCLLTIAICLGPLIYIRVGHIKIKNPKPLFVEPRLLLVVPLSLLASGLTFIAFCIVLAIPPLDVILDELDNDSFIGNLAITLILLISLFGPLCIYSIRIMTRYKQIIEYNTPEWKKFRADRKAANKK